MPNRGFDTRLLSVPKGMGVTGIAVSPPCSDVRVGGSITSGWNASGVRRGRRFPKSSPKRGRLWLNDGACVRLSPTHRHHVWSCDAMQDRTHDGRPMRILTVMDEFSTESLDIMVNRKLNADDLIRCSTDLFAAHGPPEHNRPKNVKWNVGAEFNA